jgi:hypothetical protein
VYQHTLCVWWGWGWEAASVGLRAVWATRAPPSCRPHPSKGGGGPKPHAAQRSLRCCPTETPRPEATSLPPCSTQQITRPPAATPLVAPCAAGRQRPRTRQLCAVVPVEDAGHAGRPAVPVLHHQGGKVRGQLVPASGPAAGQRQHGLSWAGPGKRKGRFGVGAWVCLLKKRPARAALGQVVASASHARLRWLVRRAR